VKWHGVGTPGAQPKSPGSSPALRPAGQLALAVIGALFALRVIYLFVHGVDSDEPQNLHVIYRWWKGDLPYLDQFDNHTPLFHWLFLPFAALTGENANVVVFARLALVPFSFGAVWLFYVICRRLYDRLTALWSVAITLALADWALKSIEFRPDILWMLLWFAALCFLVRRDGRSGPLAFFIAGILLGASACASVKTLFLLPALGIGWAGAWVLSRDFREWFTWPVILRCTIAAIAGFAIVPGILVACFASRGALDEMAFCVYAINKDPFLTNRSWIFFTGLPIAIAAAAWLIRGGGMRGAQRGAVFLSAAAYTLAIIGFGPYESLAKQTFLPAYPLLLAAACHLVLSLRSWRDGQISLIGSTACIALTIAMMAGSPPWRDGTESQRELLRTVLEHTAPNDYVMDRKGETVFRKRPVYLVYVGNTEREMESGQLKAPDPQQLAETVTAIAIERTSSFPKPMQNFLRENYVSTIGGQLRAAGKVLKPSFENGRWIERTSLAIPGTYVVVKDDEVISEITLSSGTEQTFTFPDRQQRILFWKPAWDRGLRPAGK
jgi:hypothetical protein